MCVNDYKVADRRVYLNSLNQRSDHFAKLQKINGQAYLFWSATAVFMKKG